MGVPGNANPLLLVQAAAAGGYEVSRSLRFNSSDSAYLSRTPASAGNRKTWTWAGWVKLGKPSTFGVLFDAGAANTDTANLLLRDTGVLQFYAETNSTQQAFLQTSQVLRDYSAWYHIVLAIDTTQATGSNRVKFYLNGSQITAFSTASYPSQNADLQTNAALLHTIGRGAQYQPNFYFDGSLADIWFLDGIAATPSDFAETDATTGQWIPKTYSGSKGSNGFHLEFADNSAATAAALGKDTANSNNWTPNNFSVTAGAGNDSLVDTPSSYGTDDSLGGSVRGNYCTLNPLANGLNLTNGNLDFDIGARVDWKTTTGTYYLSSGKWYWEVTTATQNTSAANIAYGIRTISSTSSFTNELGYNDSNYAYFASGGKRVGNTASIASYGASYTTGDVIGVALDMDAGTLTMYKNGSSQGTLTTGLTGSWTPAFGVYTGGTQVGTSSFSVNFGQRSWAYAAPAGFKALCTTNLPEPTIADGSTAMDIILYTGNGSSRSLTGLNFNPDFIWQKPRSEVASHRIVDSVRGVDLVLKTNLTNAEATEDGVVDSFDSNGFTGGGTNAVTSGQTAVAWCWDAGSSTVTNTQGSITSQVRANASAGFSVVTYTGNGASSGTIGHGLGVAPSLIIRKARSAADSWFVYHRSIGATKYILLQATTAEQTSIDAWNDTAPSSTVFSNGKDGILNGTTYVAYCFAPVAGYTSMGSYVGNGSSDGVFQWCGFRPKYLLVKSSTSVIDWIVEDASRSPYNQMDQRLYPNDSVAEASNGNGNMDFLSNGFKLRNAHAAMNASSQTYVWAAFAESPFQYARAR